jgi:hypothetical protein
MNLPAGADQTAPSNRLSVWISALLVLFTLTAASFAIWTLHDDRLEDAQSDLERLSTALAEQATRSVQAVDIVLRQVMDRANAEHIGTPDQLRQGMGDEHTHALLVQLRSNLPQADAIVVIGPDGMLVNTSRQWPVPSLELSDPDVRTGACWNFAASLCRAEAPSAPTCC